MFWSIFAGQLGFGLFWPKKLVFVDFGRKTWFLTETTGSRRFWPENLVFTEKIGFGRFWPKQVVLVDLTGKTGC